MIGRWGYGCRLLRVAWSFLPAGCGVCTTVLVCDALVGLGRFLRYVLLDAYRGQLRFAPWIFGLLYGLFARFRALRGLGRAGLAFFGARSLLRFVNGCRRS